MVILSCVLAWAKDLITSSDLSLNISTELMGVLLSIPLSVYIASSLDRRAENRRMRRSLQAVSADVRHELHYFLHDLPNRIQERIQSSEQHVAGRRVHQTFVWAGQIARQNVENSISAARGVFGDSMTDEIRSSLTTIAWDWQQVEILCKLRLYNVVDEQLSTPEVSEVATAHYRGFLRNIVENLVIIEKAINKNLDANALCEEIDIAIPQYAEFISMAYDFIKSRERTALE